MWVYVLSILAALCFGAGSVVQQRAASEAPPEDVLSWRLLLWLVHRPLWLAGVAFALVGNLFAANALGRGSIALVEPLFVVRLLFALPLAAAWMRRPSTTAGSSSTGLPDDAKKGDTAVSPSCVTGTRDAFGPGC